MMRSRRHRRKFELKAASEDTSRVRRPKNSSSGVNKLTHSDDHSGSFKLQKLKDKMEKNRIRVLNHQNKNEEKEIKLLEKKLKLKFGNVSALKAFKTDGLDYLLEVCGGAKYEEKKSNFENKVARTEDSKSIQCTHKRKSSSRDNLHESSEIIPKSEELPPPPLENVDGRNGRRTSISIRPSAEKETTQENAAHQKYLLRWREETQEDSTKLRKQIKGQINRLTGTNIHTVAAQIEKLYASNSRNEINRILTNCLMESLISDFKLPSRMIIEHVSLIFLLHVNIGNEVSAYILEHLLQELNEIRKSNSFDMNKKCDNIIVIIAQLYNFKVIDSMLILDILHKLAEELTEKEVELILIMLESVGFHLRKDDPVRLKEFVFFINKKVNESLVVQKDSFGSRVKFMLETLTAIKNNNILKIRDCNLEYVEHVQKILKPVLHSAAKVNTQLRISLADLLNAKSKGRWWLVGSAWQNEHLRLKTKEEEKVNSDIYNQNILNLAKRHHMNTDIRKSIFYILVSAQDFLEACEKVEKLKLKIQQYQEIFHVLTYCLLQERTYNPYYAFVSEKLCSLNHKYQTAVKFSLWDKFKEIELLEEYQIRNLAKFISYLLLEEKLPLAMLKVLDFTKISMALVKLLREILLPILLADDESIILSIFSKISKTNDLFMLREGLLIFVHKFLLNNSFGISCPRRRSQFSLLVKRISLVESVLQKL